MHDATFEHQLATDLLLTGRRSQALLVAAVNFAGGDR